MCLCLHCILELHLILLPLQNLFSFLTRVTRIYLSQCTCSCIYARTIHSVLSLVHLMYLRIFVREVCPCIVAYLRKRGMPCVVAYLHKRYAMYCHCYNVDVSLEEQYVLCLHSAEFKHHWKWKRRVWEWNQSEWLHWVQTHKRFK